MSSPDGPVTAAGSPRAAIVDDAAADPRVSGLPPVTSGAVRTYRGMPLTGTDGDVVGALCVFGPQPRSWTDGDRVLLRQLADSVATELELSALAREFEAHRLGSSRSSTPPTPPPEEPA